MGLNMKEFDQHTLQYAVLYRKDSTIRSEPGILVFIFQMTLTPTIDSSFSVS